MDKISSIDNELVVFKNSQGLKARGTLLKLSQNYIVFEVYNPYSIVQLSEVLQDVKILRSDKIIYNGKAVVANIVNTGVILIVTATISDLYWKETVDVTYKESVVEEIKYLVNKFEENQKIDTVFKIAIYDLESFLRTVKNWLDKLEPTLENKEINTNSSFIADYFSPLLQKAKSLYDTATNIFLSEMEASDLALYKEFLHNRLHPFLMSSPFPYRAYSKPLGFAGDYMMMHMIQRDTAEGQSLYAKFINVFYTKIPIMTSVNNRTVKLMSLISEGVKNAEQNGEEFNSISIGCGPALEVKRFIENNSPKIKCNFGLLDFNEETLNFAQSEAMKVIGSKKIQINPILKSVHSLLKDSVSTNDSENIKYDLVYCSGLFDYLSDRICSKLTRLFFSWLKPGGKVLVTNMHSNDKDRFLSELILEWYLIYRDEDNMAGFVPGLGEQKLYTDSTGVNLCLEITKN